MKYLFLKFKLYLHKFMDRVNSKKNDSCKMPVHYRRDLDALGEYIKIWLKTNLIIIKFSFKDKSEITKFLFVYI